MKKLNIYLHIPYCTRKCSYCAFYTISGRQNDIPAYVDALINQIRSSDLPAQAGLTSYTIETIYLGGGTPSLLNQDQITSILNCFSFAKGCEVTLEANPESYAPIEGPNRVSFGLQAWQNEHLVKLGRTHTTETFVEAFQKARTAGCKNISVDLIFGLPNQTLAEWKESLSEVIGLNPEHLSCYSLELDHPSQWGALYRAGRLTPASEEIDRQMYQYAKAFLVKKGYHHYEISNFAKPGYECRHNLDFWHHQEYLGFGAGAHSYIDGQHFHTNPDFSKTIDSTGDPKLEWVSLRLRLIAGFSPQEYQQQFETQFVDDYKSSLITLQKYQLISVGEAVTLTPKGQDLINKVVEILHTSHNNV